MKPNIPQNFYQRFRLLSRHGVFSFEKTPLAGVIPFSASAPGHCYPRIATSALDSLFGENRIPRSLSVENAAAGPLLSIHLALSGATERGQKNAADRFPHMINVPGIFCDASPARLLDNPHPMGAGKHIPL